MITWDKGKRTLPCQSAGVPTAQEPCWSSWRRPPLRPNNTLVLHDWTGTNDTRRPADTGQRTAPCFFPRNGCTSTRGTRPRADTDQPSGISRCSERLWRHSDTAAAVTSSTVTRDPRASWWISDPDTIFPSFGLASKCSKPLLILKRFCQQFV